jgi:hypothetical protein
MISLTPGFSRVVTAITYALNRFSGLPPDEKPLKRFYRAGALPYTSLKRGVNETHATMEGQCSNLTSGLFIR